jgi:hypothetical protein
MGAGRLRNKRSGVKAAYDAGVSALVHAVIVAAALATWMGRRMAKRDARPRRDEGAPWVEPELPAALRRARVGSLSDVRDGEYVAIRGRVEALEAIVAPMTGAPCVAFDLLVVGSLSREIEARVVRGSVFAVTDGRGRALVDGRTALIRVPFERARENLDRGRMAEPGVLRMADERALLTGHEGVVSPGAEVVVIGVVTRTAALDEGAYRGASEVVRIAAAPGHASMVSTIDGDRRWYQRAARARGWRR